MAFVIDANDLTSKKAKLPTIAFLVDTNIVIDFKDPFGRTSVDLHYAQINTEIRKAIEHLKSHHKCFSTLSVAIEYYKYLQVNYYKIALAKDNFSPDDFKLQRNNNSDFIAGWELHIRNFQRLFKKNFEIYNLPIDIYDLLNTFDGKLADFGDQILYKYSLIDRINLNCIFSRDKDFFNLPDDFYLITIDKNIISTAKSNNKLYLT